MDQELKQKWVSALRSGDYKQGKYQLRDNNNQYCCLGVLCVVSNKKLSEDGIYVLDDAGKKAPQSFFGELMGGVHLNKLIHMNDTRNNSSFLEIADYIEQNL